MDGVYMMARRPKPKFRRGEVVFDIRRPAYRRIVAVGEVSVTLQGQLFRVFSEVRPLTRREKGRAVPR